DAEMAGDDEADMPDLAPLPADRRPNRLRPAPAGLVDEAPDGEVAEVDDVRADVRELDDLVGLVDVLPQHVRHRGNRKAPLDFRTKVRVYRRRMRVGEVAARAGVNVETLR